MIDKRLVKVSDNILQFGCIGSYNARVYISYIVKYMPLNDFKKLIRVIRWVLVYPELICEALEALIPPFDVLIACGAKQKDLRKYEYLMTIYRKEKNNVI